MPVARSRRSQGNNRIWKRTRRSWRQPELNRRTRQRGAARAGQSWHGSRRRRGIPAAARG
jgi:hypothetical protein